MQHLLARASWDTDGVRDDLRDYVVGALGDTDAVLVVDETGDLKKGVHTVGVQRQYTGTAGRIENAQVAVYLAYAGTARARDDRPRALPARVLDRAIPTGCAGPGCPTTSSSPTKPALAAGMLTRALGRRGPGPVGGRRRGLRRRPAAARRAGGPPGRLRAGDRLRPPRPDRRPARSAPTSWPPGCRGGPGSGSRPGPARRVSAIYDWAWIDHPDRAHRDDPLDTQCWWLLIRRHRDTGELAYLPLLQPRAGAAARTGPGRRPPLDASRSPSRPARAWPGWTSTRSAAGPPGGAGPCWRCSPTPCSPSSPPPSTPTDPHPTGLIALTCNEIRRLFTILIVEPARVIACPLAWSRWRRRHQHRARTSHYQRQHADHPHP